MNGATGIKEIVLKPEAGAAQADAKLGGLKVSVGTYSEVGSAKDPWTPTSSSYFNRTLDQRNCSSGMSAASNKLEPVEAVSASLMWETPQEAIQREWAEYQDRLKEGMAEFFAKK